MSAIPPLLDRIRYNLCFLSCYKSPLSSGSHPTPIAPHCSPPQAAVLEAQAWMGSSGALMGRSHLVGPNPYVTLTLVPAGEARGRVPKIQTPYQVRRDREAQGQAATLPQMRRETRWTQHIIVLLPTPV